MTKPGEMATIRRTRFSRPPAAGSAFVITVVEGPDAGLVASLDATGPTRALLGQSPVCTIRLTDREVSRRHAALTVQDTKLIVLDLGSTNGTTVNGVLVKEAALQGGEAIRIGSSVLSVRRGEARAADLGQASSFGRVIGESPAMKRLYPALSQLAGSDRPALLEGEAGTGKELVAEEIHRASGRAEAPFITLESSTIPAAELHDALFAEGGLFQQAHGGVLFIDEIGNLPRESQAQLRETMGKVRDVRIIAATRRDLDRDVQQGRFDDDLFFLLAAGRIELPALRDREGDVPLLARHFWTELGGNTNAPAAGAGEMPEDFLPRFEHYPWPGNVRELRSAVLARMTMGELGPAYRSDEAKQQGLDFLSAVIEEDLPFPTARERVVSEFERRYVERVLARHNGNVTQAARASGVAHRYFQLVKARLK
ncbi:MAG: sigma 54-interacting transcriptional regulator [Labilithrix sp.]|nr:sigma 54-interacting transcriptional regulator [Labilithrix sp.]MCW5810787.1 sigma 54-interacting transcriptional regulator [Labilithrix sp.]